jgi:hypothetical protein
MPLGTKVANLNVSNYAKTTSVYFNDPNGNEKWKIVSSTDNVTQKRILEFQVKQGESWKTGTKFIAPPRV